MADDPWIETRREPMVTSKRSTEQVTDPRTGPSTVWRGRGGGHQSQNGSRARVVRQSWAWALFGEHRTPVSQNSVEIERSSSRGEVIDPGPQDRDCSHPSFELALQFHQRKEVGIGSSLSSFEIQIAALRHLDQGQANIATAAHCFSRRPKLAAYAHHTSAYLVKVLPLCRIGNDVRFYAWIEGSSQV